MNILKTEKPQTIVNILNGKQSILVMKKAPKNGEGCWWYLYCSKGNKKDWHLIEVVNPDTGWRGYECDYYLSSDSSYLDDCLEGKVVARFWCDKVENVGRYNVFEYGTETITPDNFNRMTCLRDEQIREYLGNSKKLFAIHISKLEIFDKPKELSEFYKAGAWKVYEEQLDSSYMKRTEQEIMKSLNQTLTKAPQNLCYIEVE